MVSVTNGWRGGGGGSGGGFGAGTGLGFAGAGAAAWVFRASGAGDFLFGAVFLGAAAGFFFVILLPAAAFFAAFFTVAFPAGFFFVDEARAVPVFFLAAGDFGGVRRGADMIEGPALSSRRPARP
jgi:hypothetical protein